MLLCLSHTIRQTQCEHSFVSVLEHIFLVIIEKRKQNLTSGTGLYYQDGSKEYHLGGALCFNICGVRRNQEDWEDRPFSILIYSHPMAASGLT